MRANVDRLTCLFRVEQFLTPEKFAEILCEDLELPLDKFVPPIAESIRSQVLDFEAIHEVELPAESIRVVINVSIKQHACSLSRSLLLL